jgi:fumarate hydratase class II
MAIGQATGRATGRASDRTSDQVEDVRIERDTMGEVAVPASALWGAQTQRAVDNFPISGVRVDPAVIRALAAVKAAAARVNARLGVLAPDVADAVAAAAQDVADGAHAYLFPSTSSRPARGRRRT